MCAVWRSALFWLNAAVASFQAHCGVNVITALATAANGCENEEMAYQWQCNLAAMCGYLGENGS
jgi:hypothetical protein